MIKNGVDLTVGIKGLLDNGVLINMTPHPLNIIAGDTTLTLEPSGIVPRVASENIKIADGIVTTKLGDVDGLPDQVPGKLLVVSVLVRMALPDRDDLVGPDTSPQGAVRDADGRIVGVRGIQF